MSEMTSIVFLLFGAVLLLLVVRSLFSLSGITSFLRSILVLVALVIGLGALFSGFDLLNYHRLLQEEQVATLYFEQEKPQLFLVKVTYQGQMSEREPEQFHLRGDDWQLDVRLLKWHSRLASYGFQPLYHLDRISGRYRDIAQAVSMVPTVHSLYQPVAGFDGWALLQDYPALQRFVDSRYGSATYLPMNHGALYQVTLGNNGLIARPINKPAEEAVLRWQ